MSAMPVTVQEIDVKSIVPHPDNPRLDVGDVTELAASIKAVGVLEPLRVLEGSDGKWQLVIGHRRLAAAKKAQRKTVPCIVADFTDEAAVREAMLVENLQRVDLTPAEEARGILGLVDVGMSRKQIAERIGRSKSWVDKRARTIRLPDDVYQRAVELRLALEHVEKLSSLFGLVDDGLVTKKRAAELVKGLNEQGSWQLNDLLRSMHRVREYRRAIEGLGATHPVYIYDHEQVPGLTVAGKLQRMSREWAELGDGYASVKVDKRKHPKLHCHAWLVHYGWNPSGTKQRAEATAICMDPASHDKGWKKRFNTGGSGGMTAREKKSRAEKKVRTASYREAVHRRAPVGPVRAFMLEALIDSMWNEFSKKACELLEIEPEKPEYGSRDYGQALKQYAATSEAAANRAVVALALATDPGEGETHRPGNRAARELLPELGMTKTGKLKGGGSK